MITRIECANCSDVVEVTSSSVSLPFYCNACKDNNYLSTEEVLDQLSKCDCAICSDNDEVEQFYEDMTPASASHAVLIDATNVLISDLEAQNVNLLNEITSLDNRIVELRKNAEITLDDLCYWRGRVMYWIGRVSKAEDRVSKAEDHPWKNLWAYLWK